MSDDSQEKDSKKSLPSRVIQEIMAKRLGPSEDTMDRLDPIIDRLKETGDVELFYEEVAPMVAVQEVREAFTADDAKSRLSAQKSVLDRAGFRPKQKIEMFTTVNQMTREEIMASALSYLEAMGVRNKDDLQKKLAEVKQLRESNELQMVEDDGIIDVSAEGEGDLG